MYACRYIATSCLPVGCCLFTILSDKKSKQCGQDPASGMVHKPTNLVPAAPGIGIAGVPTQHGGRPQLAGDVLQGYRPSTAVCLSWLEMYYRGTEPVRRSASAGWRCITGVPTQHGGLPQLVGNA